MKGEVTDLVLTGSGSITPVPVVIQDCAWVGDIGASGASKSDFKLDYMSED